MDRVLVMRSFVKVAELGSFSAAAKALFTSGSQVSRHVADLERQVGARLVNRTARSVSLTELGVRYSEFAHRILEEIDAEDQAIASARDRPEGQLSIICPKWIGTLDLGDAIAEFAISHPKIRVRFELGGMSSRTYDFLDSGFDVAFHTRDLRDSGVRLKRIADIDFVLCASDEYLSTRGKPAGVEDLSNHDCLVHASDATWLIGDTHFATLQGPDGAAFLSNSYLALQKAAVKGRGVALLPRRSVAGLLDEGVLREVLSDIGVPDRPLFAIYSPGQQTPEKVRVFLDFMTEWFAAAMG